MDENPKRDFWQEIVPTLESRQNNPGNTSHSRFIIGLTLVPLLLFLRSFILGGKFLKGRKGYREAVHEAVWNFSGKAREYEIYSAGKMRNDPRDEIKTEWQ